MSTLIFDLDGVIWYGGELIHPHIPLLIRKLQSDGNKVYFLTNNSMRSQYGYQRKLSSLGIKVHCSEIICSAHATRMYLQKEVSEHQSVRVKKKKPRIFVIGEEPLKKEIEKIPATLTKIDDEGKVDYVVVGVDFHFTYKKLQRAMHAILDGAKLIATNTDKTFPVKNKKLNPGCGALVSAIVTATDCKPHVIGKPNPFIIKSILDKSCVNYKNVYVIGDRLDTDITLANRLGVRSILVLSGATTLEMAKEAKGLSKPEYIIKNVTEINKVLNS